MSRPLHDLSEDDYEYLKVLGYLFMFYPEATGDYLNDKKRSRIEERNLEKLMESLEDVEQVD